MHISDLQAEAAAWRARNFPDYTAWQQLLGVMEEVGELSHAYLKLHQGIRGMDRVKFMDEAQDAVGDILIFLTGFCTAMSIDMDTATRIAWDTVSRRDWQNDPLEGIQPQLRAGE